MKKKNGFISISIIYTFFLVFLMTLIFIISRYTDARVLLKVVKNDAKESLDIAKNNYHNNCNDNSLSCIVAKTYNTDSNLYFHNSLLLNGANDLSYRYAGSNPNNYVCFGASSSCPLTNMYRIIGLFKIDGNYHVKLIKAEYVTSTELDLVNNSTTSSSSTKITNRTNIHTFTSSDINNNWLINSINTKLNNTIYGFLKNFTESWQDLIYKNNYFVGGNAVSLIKNQNVLNAYNNEIGTNRLKENENKCVNTEAAFIPCTIDLLESFNYVGLMYASDYAYATTKDAWTLNLASYSNTTNKNNNWLYNGVNEYLITRDSDSLKNFYYLKSDGSIDTSSNNSKALRPVMYLKSDVLYQSGNGSFSNPYYIAI